MLEGVKACVSYVRVLSLLVCLQATLGTKIDKTITENYAALETQSETQDYQNQNSEDSILNDHNTGILRVGRCDDVNQYNYLYLKDCEDYCNCDYASCKLKPEQSFYSSEAPNAGCITHYLPHACNYAEQYKTRANCQDNCRCFDGMCTSFENVHECISRATCFNGHSGKTLIDCKRRCSCGLLDYGCSKIRENRFDCQSCGLGESAESMDKCRDICYCNNPDIKCLKKESKKFVCFDTCSLGRIFPLKKDCDHACVCSSQNGFRTTCMDIGNSSYKCSIQCPFGMTFSLESDCTKACDGTACPIGVCSYYKSSWRCNREPEIPDEERGEGLVSHCEKANIVGHYFTSLRDCLRMECGRCGYCFKIYPSDIPSIHYICSPKGPIMISLGRRFTGFDEK